MSQVKANKIQAGISLTPANNFILDASADDGTVVLKRADGTEVLQVDASGNLIGKSADSLDATVNRLIQVGDFGLGSTACPTVSDADDAVLSGVYAGPGGTGVNFPGSTKYGVLFVGTRTGTIVMQVAVYSTQTYKRRSADGGSTWDDWTLMYDQRTILGTVSQSAGEPTGAIIERDSNANGEYVKFADGTMMCTREITTADLSSRSITNANSAGGYRSGENAITLSANFVAAGVPSINIANNSYGIGVRGQAGINSVSLALWAINSAPSPPTTYGISIVVIGRWF